jgi:TRAP-type C4-dicarboxylate transport system substrate-binding protein
VRQNFHRFQQLPPERRQMLREQWRNATPSQRQQMVEHAREQRPKGPVPHPPPPPPPHH